MSDSKKITLLFRSVGASPRLFFVALGLSLVATVFEALSLFLMLGMTKAVIERNFLFFYDIYILKDAVSRFEWDLSKFNLTIFLILVGLGGTARASYLLFFYVSQVVFAYWRNSVVHKMRVAVIDRLFAFGKYYFDTNGAGELHVLTMAHTEQISTSLMRVKNFVFWIAMLTAYVSFMLFASWKLTLVLATIGPLYYTLYRKLMKKIRNSSEDIAKFNRKLGHSIHNILSCRQYISAVAGEEQGLDAFDESSRIYAAHDSSMTKKSALMTPMQQLILLIPAFAVIVYVGYLLETNSSSEIASMVVLIYVVRRISQGMSVVLELWTSLGVISGRVTDVLYVFSDERKYIVEAGDEHFEGLQDEITFDGLNFSYPNREKVLESINLTVEKGRVTALVGPSGAGKTTLVNLLLRQYDCPERSIFVDGKDIRCFSLKSLKSHFSYVSQHVEIFNDTLRANILFGLEENYSDEILLAMAEKAQLKEVIERLENGLGTELGDRGVQLSGGEKQRVSILRAMLRDADILVLDEATSALDSVTESKVQAAIDELIQGRTAIIVAHRLSTIRNADKIVTMTHGKVVEEGSFAELVARRGAFHKFWEQQRLEH